MKPNDPLQNILKRHGVADADQFLSERGERAGIKRSPDPDVRMRGSVQLIKGRTVTVKAIGEGLAKLKLL